MSDTKPLHEVHENLVPMGCQVSSKGRHRYCRGFGPRFISKAEGCRVWDDQGRQYIDWTMGLGAITIGHQPIHYPNVAFPLPSYEEVMLAELVEEWVPCAEMVRFMKNGSDATSACVRLARAYTGRDVILRCGYHGWHDWALNADYASKKGVPQAVRDLTISVKYNEPAALEKAIQDFKPACFILEAVSLEAPRGDYLSLVRDICTRHGVILIFDEIITGFRIAPGGAQEYYGVFPDLCAMGKAMGNGAPISLVAGKREIMMAWLDTHLSGTHFGEVGAIQAAIDNLTYMKEHLFWDHQKEIGKALIWAYQASVEQHGLVGLTKIQGLPHFTNIKWEDGFESEQTLWQQEMLRRGVLVASGQFVCLDHTQKEVAQTAKAYDEALGIVAEARKKGDVEKRLECEVNTTTFRRH